MTSPEQKIVPETRKNLKGHIYIVDDIKYNLENLEMAFYQTFPNYDRSKVHLFTDSTKTAIDIKNRNLGEVSLVLTDVVMKVSGQTLAVIVRSVDPNIKILYTSANDLTEDMKIKSEDFASKTEVWNTIPSLLLRHFLPENKTGKTDN